MNKFIIDTTSTGISSGSSTINIPYTSMRNFITAGDLNTGTFGEAVSVTVSKRVSDLIFKKYIIIKFKDKSKIIFEKENENCVYSMGRQGLYGFYNRIGGNRDRSTCVVSISNIFVSSENRIYDYNKTDILDKFNGIIKCVEHRRKLMTDEELILISGE